MSQVAKAYAISDAKISFVSLVDKAANKKKFLITKSDNGSADFTTYGRILKADTDNHFVTGIVYEPMVEDSQGNYMTESEITKAAHWFMKNGGDVDVQHCFKKCDGADVVESYIAKCDMEIEGRVVKKGTWVMTMEIADSDVWDSIQNGEITGFSMGGEGVYSEEDVDLSDVGKSGEPKGLFKKLARALGLDVVDKGADKDCYNHNAKERNFHEALSIYNTLGDFLSEFDDGEPAVVNNLVKKEDFNVTNEEVRKMIGEEVSKAMEPITKQLEMISKDGASRGGVPAAEPSGEATEDSVAKIVGEEVCKAMEPVMDILEPLMKSRVVPGNLNDSTGRDVAKSEKELHYMTGMY